ncbi:hypothetical protein BAUCODRAFT_28659 [Baudoinia panamericana UAMH 10762]|uniref:Uncharacterized protein n=1 Tax=Baudoinia panamericana (strain UAMH 10762) TaxID=717646 RepID=M2M3D7_BAUPA|nr:uncharacterized protein BAUCODRAFT_28659 [Baudoinia panamericana UAMH 10762]EMC91036.1 hypothetical protein BAUCODRAFT_28659 [Baudoinia panamericana UAMH 10762]
MTARYFTRGEELEENDGGDGVLLISECTLHWNNLPSTRTIKTTIEWLGRVRNLRVIFATAGKVAVPSPCSPLPEVLAIEVQSAKGARGLRTTVVCDASASTPANEEEDVLRVAVTPHTPSNVLATQMYANANVQVNARQQYEL